MNSADFATGKVLRIREAIRNNTAPYKTVREMYKPFLVLKIYLMRSHVCVNNWKGRNREIKTAPEIKTIPANRNPTAIRDKDRPNKN
jgi:hypothetical protein